MLEIGNQAPDFTLPSDDGHEITLSVLQGASVVLYFYPKDDTTGCTREACDFRAAHGEFTKRNVTIIGASPDSVKKHDKFKSKYDLPFALVSDQEKVMLAAYGVWVEKSMYGRKYMGVERSTYLINAEGKIQAIWRKVKVPGHVDAVIKALGA